MPKIYKQAINAKTILAINSVIEGNSEGDKFEMLISPTTTKLLERFRPELQEQCSEIVWDNETFLVIRTATAAENKAAQCWHFDNYRKTILLVLKSQIGINNGDILLRENLRGAPKHIISTMLSKIIWTNPLTWSALRLRFIRDRFFSRVTLVAGDVMVFDGSTTYHGNLPIDLGVRRSILIHTLPVFKDSIITKIFHKICMMYFYKNK